MTNSITSGLHLSSLFTQQTTSAAAAEATDTKKTDETKDEPTLQAAAPGSSRALSDLFKDLPGAKDEKDRGEVKARNGWLENVTLPKIQTEFQQDDD